MNDPQARIAAAIADFLASEDQGFWQRDHETAVMVRLGFGLVDADSRSLGDVRIEVVVPYKPTTVNQVIACLRKRAIEFENGARLRGCRTEVGGER